MLNMMRRTTKDVKQQGLKVQGLKVEGTQSPGKLTLFGSRIEQLVSAKQSVKLYYMYILISIKWEALTYFKNQKTLFVT